VTKVHESEDFYYVREAEARFVNILCGSLTHFPATFYYWAGFMMDEQRSRILFYSPFNARLGPKVQLGRKSEFEEYEMLCCVDGF
jgi:hypothetical protein